MCGVIGISMLKADLNLIKKVFQESMIRGKHATGVSYLKGGVINTIKDGIPVSEFLDKYDFEDFVDSDGSVTMIGHIRYSTSDLRYNQPFQNGSVSIVHNGVISQEDPSQWVYKTETANDSELILHAILDNQVPLKRFRPSSMAVVELHSNGNLVGYRNEARPLWYNIIPNGIVFTSTKDISKRSGLYNPQRCDMFNQYEYNRNTSKISITSYEFKENIKDLQD